MALIRQVERNPERKEAPRVDYHCHISMMEYANIENPTIVSVTPEEFIVDLDEAGFQKAVVLSDRRTMPEQVSEFVSKAPDRLIGFGFVNPTQKGSADEVLRQREELGLFGLKLYPTSDGYSVNDPEAFLVYEAASSIGMPVMFHHAGMPVPGDLLKHSDPTLIDEVAYSFPELRIVLAHLGVSSSGRDTLCRSEAPQRMVRYKLALRQRKTPQLSIYALEGPPHRLKSRGHEKTRIRNRLPGGTPEALHRFVDEHQPIRDS
jgi:predicted TIM-barrel fold metal-dependent hydrolase